jgi:predicted O-methyltransferase YrrM
VTPGATPLVVNAVLERLFREKEVVHRDGRRCRVVPPGVNARRGEYLFQLVRAHRPALSLETGFAYGVSTLFIAEALRQNGSGRHIAIDPFELTRYDGLGLRHLDEAGLAQYVTFHDEPSERCLPRLVSEGVRIDFAFVDGHHLFDYVVAECLFLAQLIRTGGILVLDDANLAAVGRACDFFASNRPDFEELTEVARPGVLRRLIPGALPPPPPLLRLFRRVGDEDARAWNHFVPF